MRGPSPYQKTPLLPREPAQSPQTNIPCRPKSKLSRKLPNTGTYFRPLVPQTVFTLRGSNGVGFRVCLLILWQPVDGTRPLSNTVYMQSKSMSRSSRAGEMATVFKYVDFYIRKLTLLCQAATWHLKMVFGHNLHYMAPCSIPRAGFCMVFQRASCVYMPESGFLSPGSDFGSPGRHFCLGTFFVQIWGPDKHEFAMKSFCDGLAGESLLPR